MKSSQRQTQLQILGIAILFVLSIRTTESFVASRNRPFGLARTTPTTSIRAASMPDSFDMDELRQRIDDEYAPHVPIESNTKLAVGGKKRSKPKENVHVILFHPGTPEQGAHTIEYPKGSGNNVLLAFESSKACKKFAASLKEQNFFDPTPAQFKLEDIRKLCGDLGVFVQVVPDGVELKPPTQNVPKLGHDPHLCQNKKYLDYLFEMTDEDIEESGLLESAVYYSTLEDHPEGAWE